MYRIDRNILRCRESQAPRKVGCPCRERMMIWWRSWAVSASFLNWTSPNLNRKLTLNKISNRRLIARTKLAVFLMKRKKIWSGPNSTWSGKWALIMRRLKTRTDTIAKWGKCSTISLNRKEFLTLNACTKFSKEKLKNRRSISGKMMICRKFRRTSSSVHKSHQDLSPPWTKCHR